MNNFALYNQELVRFAGELLFAPSQIIRNIDFSDSPLNARYLNTRLRTLIPIKELRAAGSFFTCDELSLQAIEFFPRSLSNAKLILDPACGTGNLLIASSRNFGVRKRSLSETLADWGRKLAGFDIHEEFIEATKIRLILEALQRGVRADTGNIVELKNLFPHIRKHDGLESDVVFGKASHVILNPPYCKMDLPLSCKWGRGSGNSAALFMERCLKYTTNGTQIVAILPDVLRSGSRYRNWRSSIAENAEIKFKSIGRFDSQTDVDVFLIRAKAGKPKNKSSAWIKQTKSAETIEDYFEVLAGHVVPHRHPEKGNTVRYITARLLAGQTELHTNYIACKRKFSGTVITPPFVVVRRTSSPSDSIRARGTLIRGEKPVAVENHLLILKPKSGYVRDCRKLLKRLARPETNDFLNHRIRCRHLTVSAVKEIPWRGDIYE